MKVSLESSVILFTDYWESDCQHLQEHSIRYPVCSKHINANRCSFFSLTKFFPSTTFLKNIGMISGQELFFSRKHREKNAAESSVDLLYSPPSPIHPTFTDWGMRPCGVPFTPQITLEKTSPHPSRTKLLKPLWFRASFHERGGSLPHLIETGEHMDV